MKKIKEMNFFEKAELVISHPHKFFDVIQKEKGISKVFEFYFIFVLFMVIINALFSLPDMIKSKLDIPLINFTLVMIILVVFILITVLAISFLSLALYWVYHILIKVFNGKKGFNETYKIIYAATPLFIASLIPYYGFFKVILYPAIIIALLDTVYIEYIGLRKLQNLSRENAIAVITISLLIGFFILKIFVKMGSI